MAFFSPLTKDEWLAIGVEAYNAYASKPANTGPGSTMGAVEQSAAAAALELQQQLLYLAAIARLSTIPALTNGQPSPDAISFAAPFGITPLGSIAAGGAFLFQTASPVANGPLVIPVGGVAQTAGGLQFVVVADTTNSNYSVSLGGYPINNGGSSTTVTMQCVTPGSIGNIPANTSLTPYNVAGSAPIVGISQISNPANLTTGEDGESDVDFKARFTILVSSGRAGTANAIIGAVLSTGTGIIYSFGDRVNADLSVHNAYFTFVVNYANSGTTTPPGLITQAQGAIDSIYGRSAGISYQVIGPTLVTVTPQALLIPKPGFAGADVIAAANAQAIAFINAIGLNPDTTSTVCSLAKMYASLLQTKINGQLCVDDVQNLLLNGSAADVTASFAFQLVAGTPVFTTP
jgi:Baseplate J-like protein